jgi:hypothetical protein
MLLASCVLVLLALTGGDGGGAVGAMTGLSSASRGRPCVYSNGMISSTVTASACKLSEVTVVQIRCEPESQHVSSKLSVNIKSS